MSKLNPLELCCPKEENQEDALSLRIELVRGSVSSQSPGLGLNQELTETPQIKEEPEELSIKLEAEPLLTSVPEFITVCVKTEDEEALGAVKDSGSHSHRETEGLTEHSSDTDNDDDWELPDGGLNNYDQLKDRSVKRSPIKKSSPETTVHNEDGSGAEEKKHECTVCHKTFWNKHRLLKHNRVHTGERPFSCSLCTRTFANKSGLDYHTKTHTGEKPFSCTVCQKTFIIKGDLERHNRTHTGEKPYRCSVCNKTFADKSYLIKHIRSHTEENPHSCPFCQKTFMIKGHLDTHMRTHTGERPYSCSICNKTFARNGVLNKHMRIHTGECYSCTFCRKSFVDKGYLEKHMNTHTGEEPYSCPVCDKTFFVKYHLDGHMRTHTGEKPYSCSVCNKSYSDKRSFQSHVSSHSAATTAEMCPVALNHVVLLCNVINVVNVAASLNTGQE